MTLDELTLQLHFVQDVPHGKYLTHTFRDINSPFFINYTYVIYVFHLFNCLLVPTLTFVTIRRHIWLLKIFAYAKIDSRLQDARGGLPLGASHRATFIHITESGSPEIEAVHVARRVKIAGEIGGITADVRRAFKRVNIAANITKYILYMF